MLTPAFYARYPVLPARWCLGLARIGFGAAVARAGTRFVVDGLERVPRTPVLFATNSTQKHDFLAFRWIMLGAERPVVTVTKAKNYHQRASAFLLSRLGVVPLASRGYLVLLDFAAVHRRRPTDAEYRALRDTLDHGAPLPAGPVFEALAATRRTLVGQPRGDDGYRGLVGRAYAASLAETVRLAGAAVAAGHAIQMYPEGTVSPTLGRGRIGAVQLAWALGLPIVPVGMSGCPDAFAGDSPWPRRGGGALTIRFGAPLALPADLVPPGFRPFAPDDERTHRAALTGFTDGVLMPSIDALLDPPFRHRPGTATGKGLRAHL